MFLYKIDAIGVKGWGSARILIPWELGDRGKGIGVRPRKESGDRRG